MSEREPKPGEGEEPAADTGSTDPPRSEESPEEGESRVQRFIREVTTGSVALTVLSVFLALVIGAVLIIFSDEEVRGTLGYVFARPSDFLITAWQSVSGAYQALFEGSVVNFGEYTIGRALRPFGDTLTNAVPLIAAGLGVTLAFRTGLFNIGAEGQIIVGAIFATWVGTALHLPLGVHLVAGILAGMLGGALWAGIVGLLKARTGAHEVIVTIMLNYVARFLVAFLLTTPLLQAPGSNQPESANVERNAVLPLLFGDASKLHLGIVLVLLAAVGVWWLLGRSTVGFELRTVGANPDAARTAGMSVGRSYVMVMLFAGALSGLAAVSQVLGTERYLTASVSSNFGFDAITVALLGRASPLGTVLAGILFGAFRAGSVQMEASTGTPVDIVAILQSLIVLFIAAPPLIRSIFRIRVREQRSAVAEMSKGWS